MRVPCAGRTMSFSPRCVVKIDKPSFWFAKWFNFFSFLKETHCYPPRLEIIFVVLEGNRESIVRRVCIMVVWIVSENRVRNRTRKIHVPKRFTKMKTGDIQSDPFRTLTKTLSHNGSNEFPFFAAIKATESTTTHFVCWSCVGEEVPEIDRVQQRTNIVVFL